GLLQNPLSYAKQRKNKNHTKVETLLIIVKIIIIQFIEDFIRRKMIQIQHRQKQNTLNLDEKEEN
ncbi:hypothetical protein ACJBPP_11070, partial [Streptococcus suis]